MPVTRRFARRLFAFGLSASLAATPGLAAAEPETAPAETPADPDLAPEPSRPPPPSRKPRVFGRIGAGYAAGELFLGDDAAVSLQNVPILAEVGLHVRERVSVAGGLLVSPGRSTHGLAMHRAALGGQVELRLGPLVVALGPHLAGFGAWRKTAGNPGRNFQPAESVLWRLGLGVHASVLAQAPVAGSVSVFAGVRGDIDALLASPLGEDPVPIGVGGMFGGLAF